MQWACCILYVLRIYLHRPYLTLAFMGKRAEGTRGSDSPARHVILLFLKVSLFSPSSRLLCKGYTLTSSKSSIHTVLTCRNVSKQKLSVLVAIIPRLHFAFPAFLLPVARLRLLITSSIINRMEPKVALGPVRTFLKTDRNGAQKEISSFKKKYKLFFF